MPKPGDNLSTLFRSLGPDSASLQPPASAVAHEAEQRWPLIKALPPRRQEAPPPLSAEERKHWSRPDAPQAGPRKPALSMPSMSSKLAQSLNKMGGPRSQPAALPEPAARAERALPTEAPQPLFAALEQAEVEPDRVEPDRAEQPARLEMFQGNSQQPPDAAQAGGADNALAGIFQRLEGIEDSAAKAPPRRTSFFDRWTKR